MSFKKKSFTNRVDHALKENVGLSPLKGKKMSVSEFLSNLTSISI